MAWLSTSRQRSIEDLAEQVADTHCPEQVVDPLAILESKGITTSFNYYGQSFDGMLEHKRGRFHMYGNLDRLRTSTSPRARFTQGHELGHYFIDEHRSALQNGAPPHVSLVDQTDAESTVEAEADLFASHLLMPNSRFADAVKSSEQSIAGIVNTCRLFNVSCTSAAIRFVTTSSAPLALVYWRTEKSPRSTVNSAMKRLGISRIRANSQKLPPDSSTALAMADSSDVYDKRRLTHTLASAWSNGVTSGSAQDIVLVEESLRLGRYGVLTILRPID